MLSLRNCLIVSLLLTFLGASGALSQAPCDAYVIDMGPSTYQSSIGMIGTVSEYDLRYCIGKTTWISFDYRCPYGSTCWVWINNTPIGFIQGTDDSWHAFCLKFNSRVLSGFEDCVSFELGSIFGPYVDGFLETRNVTIHCWPAKKHSYVWRRAEIHFHTNSSDGSKTMDESAAKVKAAGCSIGIVTDHYEQIAAEKKAWWDKIPGVGTVCGFDNYLAACSRLSNKKFSMIAGAEVETWWQPEPNVVEKAHSLIFPLTSPQSDPVFDSSFEKEDAAYKVANRAWELGMITAAAHPQLIQSDLFGAPLWEWQRYRYDMRNKSWCPAQLIGMFGCATPEQNNLVFSDYLDYLKNGVPLFPYSDNDSHGWGDLQDKERWQRITYIRTVSLRPESVKDAMASGYTMATAWGLVPQTMSVSPGPKHWVCRVPDLRFKFVFWGWNKPGTIVRSPLTTAVEIYRDGVLIPGSRVIVQKGASSITVRIIDRDAPVGEHWYLVRLVDCFVSAPIWIDVVPFRL